jgi:hypothetical protein
MFKSSKRSLGREAEERAAAFGLSYASGGWCLIKKDEFTVPHGPRRGSTFACLLGLRLRIPPEAWKSVVNVMLSGRGL